MASVEETLHKKLEQALNPSYLKVTNTSVSHHSHQSSPRTGESHFRVEIEAAIFQGMSLVQRHRKVYEVLGEEFEAGLHALEIRAEASKIASS